MPKIKVLLFISFLVFFTFPIFADTTPPSTNHTLTPSTPNGKNSWYTVPVTVKIDATDLESGVKEINYRVNNGTWQKVSFPNTLNLITNPSFETPDYYNATGIHAWNTDTTDSLVTYSQDIDNYLTGFSTSSAHISSTNPVGWFSINNKTNFAVATPYSNMNASIWVKTLNAISGVRMNVYAVNQDVNGIITYSLITQSGILYGTNEWTNISSNFILSSPTAIGVYVEVGITGEGQLWVDAASTTNTMSAATTSIVMASDNTAHIIEYYAVDNANNIETYACPTNNCATFKIDQTPPSNWTGSGSYRSAGGAEHEVFVFTNVSDNISGLSTLTNKYQYTVSAHPDFGHFASLLLCNSDWKSDEWVNLQQGPSSNGVSTAYLLTPKTDFCDSNWKVCKNVRFYAEDMAGNSSGKDFCLHGPWIEFFGGGTVRSNTNINMISESDLPNTTTLVETGGPFINFFTSSKSWYLKSYPFSSKETYDDFYANTDAKTNIGSTLPKVTGIYKYTGNYEITNQKLPSGFSTAIFDEIIFIDGDLTISTQIDINSSSTLLFVVKGDIKIDKSVELVEFSAISDGVLYTAYNINPDEATKTLYMYGTYQVNVMDFQRTLQGTKNDKEPSEILTFEPKYQIQLKNLYKKGNVIWEEIN